MNTEKKFSSIIKNLLKEYDIACAFLQGSQNYNLDTLNSDIDVKVFVLPKFSDIYNGTKISKTIETKYGLAEIKDIRQLPMLIKKGNPSYIEIVFSPYNYYLPELNIMINNLLSKYYFNKLELVEKHRLRILLACGGMAKQKYAALFKLSEARRKDIEAHGYSLKDYHHLMRLYFMIKDMVEFYKPFNEVLTFNTGIQKLLISAKKFPIEVSEVAENSKAMIGRIDRMVDNFTNSFKRNDVEYLVKPLEEAIEILIKRSIKKEIEEGDDV